MNFDVARETRTSLTIAGENHDLYLGIVIERDQKSTQI